MDTENINTENINTENIYFENHDMDDVYEYENNCFDGEYVVSRNGSVKQHYCEKQCKNPGCINYSPIKSEEDDLILYKKRKYPHYSYNIMLMHMCDETGYFGEYSINEKSFVSICGFHNCQLFSHSSFKYSTKELKEMMTKTIGKHFASIRTFERKKEMYDHYVKFHHMDVNNLCNDITFLHVLADNHVWDMVRYMLKQCHKKDMQKLSSARPYVFSCMDKYDVMKKNTPEISFGYFFSLYVHDRLSIENTKTEKKIQNEQPHDIQEKINSNNKEYKKLVLRDIKNDDDHEFIVSEIRRLYNDNEILRNKLLNVNKIKIAPSTKKQEMTIGDLPEEIIMKIMKDNVDDYVQFINRNNNIMMWRF